MIFPDALLEAIHRVTASVDHKALYKGAQELSFRYRQGLVKPSQAYICSEEECLAYLCTRFPATFGANHYVFSEVLKKGLGKDVFSILDLGSGSGAALWAASSLFDTLSSYTLVERDPRLIEIGKKLLKEAFFSFNPEWILADYTQNLSVIPHDLVVISYSLGEVESHLWEKVLFTALEKTKQFLVILEPGTPLGYKKLMKMRDYVVGQGLYVVAPCPHSEKCPMKEPRWCHFSQRLPRTTLHKSLKDATLGFEDEKFSYMIFSKQAYVKEGFRVIHTPVKRSGFIELEVCSTSQGIFTQKVSKKQKEFFNKVKKTNWGSFYE
jgi:ribosomal protein RSM22 (predicted rRNA methylase)